MKNRPAGPGGQGGCSNSLGLALFEGALEFGYGRL